MIPTITTHGEGNLFLEEEMPFNLTSETIFAPPGKSPPTPATEQAELFPANPQEAAA